VSRAGGILRDHCFFNNQYCLPVAYAGIFLESGGSTNSVGDRGQRELGSGGGRP
jgi:hypothetical protein